MFRKTIYLSHKNINSGVLQFYHFNFVDEWNVYTVSSKICQSLSKQHSVISLGRIEKHINDSLTLDKCIFYFKEINKPTLRDAGGNNNLYIILSALAVLIIAVSCGVFKCLRKKRKNTFQKRKQYKFKQVYGECDESLNMKDLPQGMAYSLSKFRKIRF